MCVRENEREVCGRGERANRLNMENDVLKSHYNADVTIPPL